MTGTAAPGPRRKLPPGVVLRDMREADVPAVHALELALFPIDAWPEQMFRDELAQPQTRRYYVAEESRVAEEIRVAEENRATEEPGPEGPRIVAYAGLMCVEPIADVQTIAVVPEREGQGLGSAILAELIAEARRRGAEDVLLEVRADNPRAQALYRRFGFAHIHTRRRYYRDGADALIMQLPLAAGTPTAEGETE